MNCIHFVQIHTSDILFCSNSSPILKLSVIFASQICQENTNKPPLDGAYLVDFGIDITVNLNHQVDIGVLTFESLSPLLGYVRSFYMCTWGNIRT